MNYHVDHLTETISFDFILGTPDPREMSTNYISPELFYVNSDWYGTYDLVSPDLLPQVPKIGEYWIPPVVADDPHQFMFIHRCSIIDLKPEPYTKDIHIADGNVIEGVTIINTDKIYKPKGEW